MIKLLRLRYSVLELTTPPYRADLIISYAFRTLTPPQEHCTVYMTLVSSYKDASSPANIRHLLPDGARNERWLVKSADETIHEDKVMPLAGDEVKRLLGRYCPEDSNGEWVRRWVLCGVLLLLMTYTVVCRLFAMQCNIRIAP